MVELHFLAAPQRSRQNTWNDSVVSDGIAGWRLNYVAVVRLERVSIHRLADSICAFVVTPVMEPAQEQ